MGILSNFFEVWLWVGVGSFVLCLFFFFWVFITFEDKKMSFSVPIGSSASGVIRLLLARLELRIGSLCFVIRLLLTRLDLRDIWFERSLCFDIRLDLFMIGLKAC